MAEKQYNHCYDGAVDETLLVQGSGNTDSILIACHPSLTVPMTPKTAFLVASLLFHVDGSLEKNFRIPTAKDLKLIFEASRKSRNLLKGFPDGYYLSSDRGFFGLCVYARYFGRGPQDGYNGWEWANKNFHSFFVYDLPAPG
ncbi:MAG: hypothetical protein JNL76_02145 [Alphaproteobacteria bacterium]|nr:hypothetical protein [Alphaproteobacteria bacterium]